MVSSKMCFVSTLPSFVSLFPPPLSHLLGSPPTKLPALKSLSQVVLGTNQYTYSTFLSFDFLITHIYKCVYIYTHTSLDICVYKLMCLHTHIYIHTCETKFLLPLSFIYLYLASYPSLLSIQPYIIYLYLASYI